MHPSFQQFIAALQDPALRPAIGLSISDQDASTLLTRIDWVNDYYSRWIALFPPAAAPAPEAAAVQPAPVLPPAGFGPPPTAGANAAPGVTAAGAASAAEPRRALPSAARIALITVLTLVALSIVGGVISEVRAVTHAAAAVTNTHPASPSSSGAQDDPIVFHGLTQTEYDLIEAILAPQGRTLEQVVAQGADDAALQQIAAKAETSTAKTCSEAKTLDQGFDNPSLRAAFVAGYESAQKATPAQANAVFDSLAAYCGAH